MGAPEPAEDVSTSGRILTMNLRNLLVVLLCLAMTVTAFGQRKKLKPGDAAPGLDIEAWVKGDEVAIEKGTVYLVEFWATWCAPCRKSIPHLTELQQEYESEGLKVIGISDEDKDLVSNFVRKQRTAMDYTVAVDRRKSTTRSWLQAAGLKGIPAVFMVDRKGRIAFIGNPLADREEMDSILDRVIRGRYDARLEPEAQPRLKAARRARKIRNWRMALRQYEEVVDLDPNVFAETALERFEMMLVDMADPDRAYTYAQSVLMEGHFKEDVGALRMLAEKIGSDPKIPTEARDMDLALEGAQAARRIAGRDDPKALATLALVHYRRGELDEAIEYQKQAYFVALPNRKPGYRRDLKVYQGAAKRAEMSGPS